MSFERALPPDFIRARNARMRKTGAAYGVDFKTKPEYTPIGSHLTCVPDVVYGWPMWMVRQIRRDYDPGFIPIFRRLVYRTRAGGILTFIHHGVARAGRETFDPVVQNVPLPHGWEFERPTFVERWFQPARSVPGSIRAKHNLPKPFVPWSEWVLRWAAETYWAASAEEKQEYVETHGEAAQASREREAMQAEVDYVDKNEAAYRQKLVEQLGPEDERYARGLAAGAIQREKTPFVQVQGANL
jgi:hypothetical protein